MTTNVLAIIGSPRKHGNTYHVVQEVEQRLKVLGDVQVEYLYLADAHLEFCRGCFQCLSQGEERCPIHDDRAAIEARMQAADGLIFVAPAYCMMVPALMKNLIDRLAYVFHRPRFFKQVGLMVCTSAGAGIAETLKYLAITQSWGLRRVVKLGVITPLYRSKDKAIAERTAKVDKAARAFYAALADPTYPSPSLSELIHFRAIRGNTHFAPSLFPADLEYYREHGWLESDFYVETRISPVKKWLADRLVKLIGGTFESRFYGA